jgi:MinD-like ATPase involved in chromosome partitioning or flagellar assembly
VSELRPPVLLALSPLVEQQVAPLLFGDEAAVTVASSLVELAAIERTLADGVHAEALLVSADLPDLTASTLSRARSYGLRALGVAADQHDAALLRELPLDAILTTPLDPAELLAAIRPSVSESRDATVRDQRVSRRRERQRDGTVLAVVGSRGAPGASELACSLAALAAMQWQTVLVELDLLGNASLAVRLGSDAQQGSLLALLRATRSGEPALGELLERWLVSRSGWPPLLLAPPQLEQVIDELDQPGAIRRALDAVAAPQPLVLVDVGFPLAQPGPLGPVERCHREALLAADGVVLVLGAREAQLDSGLAQLDLLLETLEIPTDRVRVVCNGVSGPGAIPRTQLEQTLTVALRDRELAVDALIPWDGRALAKAVRTGLPLAAAHPRGGYARALQKLLDTLFLPGAPIARGRKRILALPARSPASTEPEPAAVTVERDEEVALPWRN